MKEQYDKTSPLSIFNFAQTLTGKSLAERVELPSDILNPKNRGYLGSLVEKYFFEHKPKSNHGPDFPEAGLELKTTGILKKYNGELSAKERLVLTMINYESIVDEKWETSSLLLKCRLMLILFYLYQKDIPVFDQKFILPPLLYSIPAGDLKQIKEDWEFIQKKIQLGLAHELSEGDTYYLGACRKGSGGSDEKLKLQPGSVIEAKSRAFSFKQGYVTKIIQGHVGDQNVLGLNADVTFEQATQLKFRKYLGMTLDQISAEVQYFKKNPRDKRFKYGLSLRMLGDGQTQVPELVKAGIVLKTITLDKNGFPKESMSFQAFNFLEILEEKWEDSKFFEQIEQKFLLVMFREDSFGNERLTQVSYWNMPYLDRLEAKRVWEETKTRLSNGNISLPRISESNVAHVRPKATKAADKATTPGGLMLTKQCFWLNQKYIEKILLDLKESGSADFN